MLRRAFPNPWRDTITWSGPPLLALVIFCALGSFTKAAAADIVIDASDIPASAIHGAWSAANDPTSPNGIKLATPATGISTTSAPFSSPTDYVDVSFTADAGVPFAFWIRLEAFNNSKASDSVWVQFSDAVVNGSSIYPMNTTSGLLVNLATDSSGSSDVNWGWVNGCYWLAQPATVTFATSGTHTVRVQVREAGVEFDQIVLSSGTYLNTAPGVRTNDTTIVAESAGAPPSSTSTTTGSVGAPLAYGGVAPNLPGDISAANFDTGGEGVSYYDTTPGNTGGAYRSTDVDLEASSIGGYDVGWIAASEWLNYTVNVTSAGAYTAQITVASPNGGGSLHIGFNTASNVWISVPIPATGSWQTWTTVNVPVTLGAGLQQMTLYFNTSGFNLHDVNVVGGGSSPPPVAPPPAPPQSGGGISITVVEWNIQVNDASAAHAEATMDYVAAMNPMPQIVAIEEARQSQYSTYLSELQSRTGMSWAGVMLTHCPLGAWNGATCTGSEDEGVAVFSTFPIVSSSAIWLPFADAYHSARAAVRLAVNVNGTTLQVFATHLQVDNPTARYESMPLLKSWAVGYSTPQLMAGDFNADVDQIDTTAGMLPNFIDSWSIVGAGPGYTCSTPAPTMKLDYWFADASGEATPNWSQVVTATGTVSDHYPLLTSFAVQP